MVGRKVIICSQKLKLGHPIPGGWWGFLIFSWELELGHLLLGEPEDGGGSFTFS